MLQLPKTPDHLSPAQGLAASQTMDLGHELVDAGGEQKVPRQTPKHDMNFTLFSYYILLYFTIFSSLRLMHVSFFYQVDVQESNVENHNHSLKVLQVVRALVLTLA